MLIVTVAKHAAFCTEMGNVIGLARLVRLGKKSHLAKAGQFLWPDAARREAPGSFSAEMEEEREESSPQTLQAAHKLDLAVTRLKKDLTEGE